MQENKCFFYKKIKKLLPLTAIAPFSPVGSVVDSFIINVPSEFTFTLSSPATFTKNIFVDGESFDIRESDDVNAPVNSTEPVICEFVVTIDSIESLPLFFLKNNLPSKVFIANSPSVKSAICGTLDTVELLFNFILFDNVNPYFRSFHHLSHQRILNLTHITNL